MKNLAKKDLKLILGELEIRIETIKLTIPKVKPRGFYSKTQQKTINKLEKLTAKIRKELEDEN